MSTASPLLPKPSIWDKLVTPKDEILSDMNLEFFNYHKAKTTGPLVLSGWSLIVLITPLYWLSKGKTQKIMANLIHNLTAKKLSKYVSDYYNKFNEYESLNMNYHFIVPSHLSNPEGISPLFIIDKFQNGIALTGELEFSGEWEIAFDAQLTQPGAFWGARGSRLESMMIMENSRHYYWEDEVYQIMELLYAGRELVLGLVHLKHTKPLQSPIVIDNHTLLRAIKKLKMQSIKKLQIPKFHVETQINLYNYLSHKNLKSIFEGDLKYELKLSYINQKTSIKLSESGRYKSSVIPIPDVKIGSTPPIDLILDRPFIFYVRHRISNYFLLIGLYQ